MMVLGAMGRYMVVLGQYNLALLGIISGTGLVGLLCLQILKKIGDLVRCYHSGTTNEQTPNKER